MDLAEKPPFLARDWRCRRGCSRTGDIGGQVVAIVHSAKSLDFLKMKQSLPDDGVQEATPRPRKKSRWGIAFAIGWSVPLLLVLPFHVFPLEIRVGVTIFSLAAVYLLVRSLRSWHYLWATPLILFWLAANYAIWTARYWSEGDYKRAVEERAERNKHHQRELPLGGKTGTSPIK